MSRDEFDDADDDVAVTRKKSMSVEQFFQQFQMLDPSNYGSWPLSVKITVWFLIFVAVILLGFFIVIRGLVSDIDTAHQQQESVLNEFRDKDSKLRNLQQYEGQLKAIEANFSQQLEQLPKESEISNLVEDINMTGVNAGLKFDGISLGSEIKQEFFIEQPIQIKAVGDYHAFGAFTGALSALPRIVTLHDFRITATQAKPDDVPVVRYDVQAKTYRYSAEPGQKTGENSTVGDKL